MRIISSMTTLILSASLLGCGTTSVKPTFTASGNEGFLLVCGGFFENGDLSGCYQKAGELCANKGYTIAQTNISSIIVQCKSNEAVVNATK